jgi:hypothetical protein
MAPNITMVKIGIRIPTERRVKIITMGIIVEEGNFFIPDNIQTPHIK